MLTSPGPLPISENGQNWMYEVKWDGMRVLAGTLSGRVRLTSRSELDVTARFREVAESTALGTLPPDSIVDGEVVAFDAQGRPSFSLLAPRIQGKREGAATVAYVLFDVLKAGGKDVRDRTYSERRELLGNLVESSTFVTVPDSFTDGPALFDSTLTQGLEGVVAKRTDSTYQCGVRSPDWVKVPHRRTRSYVIGGWKHSPSSTRGLASLLVGTPTADGLLVYDGAAGSGLSELEIRTLLTVLGEIRQETRPFHWAAALPDEATVTWTEPILVVDVEHLGRTGGAMLRQPTVIRLRPDLSYDDVWRDGGG
jgi:bifunctional non-homologous end joining protein LigD